MASGRPRTTSRTSTRWSRLRPRDRRREDVQEGLHRPAARWSAAPHAAEEPGLLAVHPAHQGREAAGGVHVPPRRRAGVRFMKGSPSAASTSGHQADRHRRSHRRRRAHRDGRSALGVISSITTRRRTSRPRTPRSRKPTPRSRRAAAAQLHGGRRLGRHALDLRALKKPGGTVDGDKAMASIKRLNLMSPRGTITIDPATRDIVQTVTSARCRRSAASSTTSSSTSSPIRRTREKRRADIRPRVVR